MSQTLSAVDLAVQRLSNFTIPMSRQLQMEAQMSQGVRDIPTANMTASHRFYTLGRPRTPENPPGHRGKPPARTLSSPSDHLLASLASVLISLFLDEAAPTTLRCRGGQHRPDNPVTYRSVLNAISDQFLSRTDGIPARLHLDEHDPLNLSLTQPVENDQVHGCAYESHDAPALVCKATELRGEPCGD